MLKTIEGLRTPSRGLKAHMPIFNPHLYLQTFNGLIKTTILSIWKYTQKSNTRMMVRTIIRETKRESQIKAKRCKSYRNQKKGKN